MRGAANGRHTVRLGPQLVPPAGHPCAPTSRGTLIRSNRDTIAQHMISLSRRRFSQAWNLGPRVTLRLAVSRGARIARSGIESVRALLLPTGMHSWQRERIQERILPSLRMHGTISLEPLERGTFDLLASGPCRIERPFDLQALPKAWRARAAELGTLAVATLAPIDWQLDPTSGQRWDARTRSSRIAYGHEPGVEVKWPWEVGRLQHLPAIAARMDAGDAAWRARAADVIRGQIVDFVRSNPPGFGVQWLCPMDVGIRIANILVAVDIARAAGAQFDPDFLKVVACTARDHARHIARNLEWGERLCSNHYLANIAGLLYVGAYLEGDREASEWLAFAGREMAFHIRSQFHPEGSNFEASSCYHRLSAEMAVHSAALMLWISRHQPERAARWWSGPVRCFHPSPAAPATARVEWPNGLAHPFDVDLRRRLWGMGQFTECLLRQDGSVPQIGDNDSGRFFRIEMADQPDADIIDHRHLVRAVRALFGSASGPTGPEAQWLVRWLGDATLESPDAAPPEHWPQFGLFTWSRSCFGFTLRCGHVGQLGNGGHAHCDQLSVTLFTPAGPIVDDPGTGVYTPRPDVRNELRASACHSTVLVPGREQAEWLPGRWGLFAMKDRAKARIVEFSEAGATAEMFDGANVVRRKLEVTDRGVRVMDVAPRGSIANFVLSPGVDVEVVSDSLVLLRRGGVTVRLRGESLRMDECPWSTRYGELSRTKRIQCVAGNCEFDIG